MKKTTLKNDILLALLSALSFSAFIYFAYFDITLKMLDTAMGLLGITLLLNISKRAIVLSGFFIGLLWFYWIGYSFEYYNNPILIPIVTLLFGFIYSIFFAPLALTNSSIIRGFMLFGLSYFEPFDFNWLQIEVIFVNSYIGVEKYQLALVLLALALWSHFKSNKFSPAILLLLVLTININATQKPLPALKIQLVTTNLAQELKWKPSMREQINTTNFKAIDDAIEKGYDVVVLPESAFALFLNMHPSLIEKLQKLSLKITIITGALYYENHRNYNVTYIFQDGEFEIKNKMVLVPFGEYIPLPKFMQNFVNETFFDGAEDYTPASKPSDYVIDGIKFRNAICYEATCQEIYEDRPQYVIAMSNNAWFTPSIEPTLQALLMKFYAQKYNTVIYHSANIDKSGIIQ